MTIILGFGSTEEQVRAEVRALFTKGLTEGRDLYQISKEYNAPAEVYDKQPRGVAPERYTRVYFHSQALHFHHINRNHALSPDGWALWVVEEPFTASEYAPP